MTPTYPERLFARHPAKPPREINLREINLRELYGVAAGMAHDTAHVVAVRVVKGIVAGPRDAPEPDGRDGRSL